MAELIMMGSFVTASEHYAAKFCAGYPKVDCDLQQGDRLAERYDI